MLPIGRANAAGRTAILLVTACLVVAAIAWLDAAHVARAQSPPSILEVTGVRGGLIVHVGCGDGAGTVALRANDSYLVLGLDREAENVRQARQNIRSAGLYGPVSADLLTGARLPLVDNLVNLVVLEDADSIEMDEVLRVLAPNGTAFVQHDGEWSMTVKPRPEEIDDWTHFMHDASGNAVSNDTVVGPPRRLQWVGGPRWGRHHEHMSSLNALVSSNGRLFYVFDEGSRAAIQLPPKWKLIARDASNGTILWKRDIPLWYTHLWPLKSGPAFLPRRLVALGDVVYATLGLDQPLVALEAATGKTIHTYDQSASTEEVLCDDGTLFLLVNARPPGPDTYTWINPVCWDENKRVDSERPWDRKPRAVMAVDAASGETLWQVESAVAPVTMCADKQHLVFHDGEKIICIDRVTGKPAWESEPVGMRLPLATNFSPTMVLYEDVVLFAGGGGKHEMAGFDAATGKKLWSAKQYRAGHRSAEDLLVIDGLAWTGRMAGRPADNRWTGYDVRTGEVKQEFDPDIESYWFHHRCHRSKATVRYLMPSRTGIEYVDLNDETWDRNHWVRGACVYGVMPSTGLTYAPQHACACYLETKLNGFNALAPAAETPLAVCPESERLEKGPAYEEIRLVSSDLRPGASSDWPTYRHDPSRSGRGATTVPAELTSAWRAELGGRLSSPVIAEGKLFVAAIDTHTIHALDAADGQPVWQFTAGGRIDSPPTIHNGCALFGSNDGYVYCLRASDGVLAWRYLAARSRDRHVAYEQVESVWPVHGSVLVREGQVYCVAGRSVFLDGGMRLCRLNATTGELISETALDERVPETGENFQTTMRGLNMPPGLPDVLSCDDRFVYMRSQKFDLEGKRTELFAGDPSWDEDIAQRSASGQVGEGTHLFSPVGFLDGSMFHRSYWLYGQMVHNGCNFWFRAARYAPSARIMVIDDETIYGFGRQPRYMLWTPAMEYRLFAADKNVRPEAVERVLEGGRELQEKAGSRWIFNRELTKELSVERLSAADVKWSRNEPGLIARALTLADETLFVAGPPDLLDEEAAVSRRWDKNVQRDIAEQDASLLGQRGATLRSVATADGQTLAELTLDSMPVWDGMAAAGGRLYLSLADGSVVCFGGK